jgi:hypothetical protein
MRIRIRKGASDARSRTRTWTHAFPPRGLLTAEDIPDRRHWWGEGFQDVRAPCSELEE